jgi:chromosome segregation ATPase
MDEKDISERLVKAETKIEEHTKVIEKLQDQNSFLVEMKTILKMQTEVNVEQKEQMKEFSKTLNNVNENLTNLNINQQQMKQEVNEIGNRVEDIEKRADEHKIDPMKVFMKILGFVGTLVGGAIAAFLYMKLGIKN